MRESDIEQFTTLLAQANDFYQNSRPLTRDQISLSFLAFEQWSIEEMKSALGAHILDTKRGRNPPLPSDISGQLEKIQAQDGRPGPQEAWALALKAHEESETVTWTDEVAQAYSDVLHMFRFGDLVAARMSFIEIYERLVRDARSNRRKCEWRVSEGFDKRRRNLAMERAVRDGRLPLEVYRGNVVSLPR